MTNQEKRNHISNNLLFQGNVYIEEARNFDNFIKKIPTVLYKYKDFDKNTFDMLENEYAFLSGVEYLDDPFDCLGNADINSMYETTETSILNDEMVSYMAKCLCGYLKKYNKKEIFEILHKCIENGEFNELKIKSTLGEDCLKKGSEEFLLKVILSSFEETMQMLVTDKGMGDFVTTAVYPEKRIGVCALSEIRDNKVMWSLYGGQYKGCCIGYEIPRNKMYLSSINPVIYERKSESNIIKKIVEFAIASGVHHVAQGKVQANTGAIMELFHTKDTDWSFQKEWRILGSPAKHIPTKIKAVYLGFKITKENENKVLEIAKKNKFSVFKMKKPSGKTKIEYTKVL